jgi:hypothetical protein
MDRAKGAEMTDQAASSTSDPHSGRPPTSHERRAGQPSDASYADGPAWLATMHRVGTSGAHP